MLVNYMCFISDSAKIILCKDIKNDYIFYISKSCAQNWSFNNNKNKITTFLFKTLVNHYGKYIKPFTGQVIIYGHFTQSLINVSLDKKNLSQLFLTNQETPVYDVVYSVMHNLPSYWLETVK